MSEPWPGHRDLCSVQWSSVCSCDPQNPIDLDEIVCERHGRYPCWSCMKDQPIVTQDT